jgi:type II secretory ATPase GspE/PulE/Tfp pilus assembly ATPase PilB-like protein
VRAAGSGCAVRSLRDGLAMTLDLGADVVLLDCIRTSEEAHLAMRAAASGRLLLAAIPGTRARSFLPHLSGLGISREHMAQHLELVIAQCLVPALCRQCALPDDSAQVRSVLAQPANTWLSMEAAQPQRARADGCAACRGTGYHGRVMVYELIAFDGATRAIVEEGAKGLELEQQLLGNGRGIWDQGIRLMTRGRISLASLRAAIAEPQ